VLRAAAARYLRLRRGLGFRLAGHDGLLAGFCDYLDARGHQQLTIADALAWAQLPVSAAPGWRAARLGVIRSFAAHAHAEDPAAAQLVPVGLLPGHAIPAAVYLYLPGEVEDLMLAAGALRPALRAASMQALIGLMAVTGARIGEIIGAGTSDLDLASGVLRVHGKNDRQRLLPLHPATAAALRTYLRLRRQLAPAPACAALLVTSAGTRLHAGNVQSTFRGLVNGCHLHAAPGGARPRLHDLRHTFAVTSLVQAYRDGADIDARIAVLATYLGHVNPVSTYYYLHASPELMTLALERLTTHYSATAVPR
jgi:integrase